ncbi:14683_t:CDS:2, partial [Cetraspora pellucida]
ARIRELENQGDNSEELERLKKELNQAKQQQASERTKSQSEIKRLQSELAATKRKEEELAAKIKELGTKKIKTQEVVEKIISWFIPPSTKSKKTEEINKGRWLTDKEIDWASQRLAKDVRFKILPAHQFHLVREAKRKDDPLIFTQLLADINDLDKELVFIPVNQTNYHWSLLVYESKSQKFWHYDTLGGTNYQYIKPLVRELLEQIREVRNIKEEYLSKYLLPRHDLRQNNGSDCGYGRFRMGEDLGEFDFQKEREELRTKYLAESRWKNKIYIIRQAAATINAATEAPAPAI